MNDIYLNENFFKTRFFNDINNLHTKFIEIFQNLFKIFFIEILICT